MNKLFDASKRGSLAELVYSLDKKVSPDTQDSSGTTALQYAALGGHEKCLQELLTRGANAFTKDTTGSTALHYAALKGHRGCIKILQKYGLKDSEDSTGTTALHYASLKGHADIVLELLSHDDSKKVSKNKAGRTPLHLAVLAISVLCTKLLLAYGGVAEESANEMQTSLHLALKNNHP